MSDSEEFERLFRETLERTRATPRLGDYGKESATQCHYCGARNGMGAVVRPRGPLGVPTCAKSACQGKAMRAAFDRWDHRNAEVPD